MPRNTAAGFIISAISAVLGFAIIWNMWLLAILGLAAVVAAIVYHTFNFNRDYYVPATEVTAIEDIRTNAMSKT
jgi:cytochrome o ubiquinol oxidase subunit 1